MALKITLTGEEVKAIPETIRSHYILQVDGSYKLDLGGLFTTDKDPAGLFSALEAERKQNTESQAYIAKIKVERKQIEHEKALLEAQKANDLEAIKKITQEQVDAVRKTFEEKEKQREVEMKAQRELVAEQYRQSEAAKIASKLFGTQAPLVLPHILNNLRCTPSDILGQPPKMEFLNAQGQPDLLATIETYEQSLLTNPMFKPILVVSKASGGSASDTRTGIASVKADGTQKSFDDYSSGDLVELLTKHPAEYDRLNKSRDSKSLAKVF